jgi:alpha-methylacyl-CoA racemase
MILADLGAEVLRITRGGARERGLEPPKGPLDRGRHDLPLNLKDPSDLARLQNLVTKADVFVEGFRPGVAERLGIGPEELQAVNPRLVYARMTGWGQDGPMADRAGHDINYLAISGALDPIGHAGGRPVPPLNLVGDFGGGGLTMTMGILAALYERNHSGLGQVVDVAMVDGSSLLMAFIHGLGASGMWAGPRGTNLFDSGAPFYDTYETADGKYVAVGCVEPQFFDEMLTILELHDAPQQMEMERWPELRELLAGTFKARTRDEWAIRFEGSDACVSPVLTPWEAPDHPHNVERRSFVDLDGCRQPAPAPRFDRTPTAPPSPARDAGVLLNRWEST